MKAVKIIIVEDELLVAEDVKEKLRRLGYDVTNTYPSGEELIEEIDENLPDIILMDIHLDGELDGIQTAEALAQKHTIPFIYLTDDRDKDTVDRAKQTRPANYIAKPFSEFDLTVAIDLALHNAAEVELGAKIEEESKERFLLNDAIFIKDKERFRKIRIDEIMRVEADRAYSKIITEQKTFTFTGSLSTICDQLTDKMFLRVHRSHLVNVNFINGIDGNMLEVGTDEVPVSQSYREEVFNHLRLLK